MNNPAYWIFEKVNYANITATAHTSLNCKCVQLLKDEKF